MADLTAKETLWGYPEHTGPTSPRPDGKPLIVVRYADDDTDENGNRDPSWCVHYFAVDDRIWFGASYGYPSWEDAMSAADKEARRRRRARADAHA